MYYSGKKLTSKDEVEYLEHIGEVLVHRVLIEGEDQCVEQDHQGNE